MRSQQWNKNVQVTDAIFRPQPQVFNSPALPSLSRFVVKVSRRSFFKNANTPLRAIHHRLPATHWRVEAHMETIS